MGHKQKQGKTLIWSSYAAVYGLKQAPRLWHSRIHAFLRSSGFSMCETQQCVYFRLGSTLPTYLLLYVDDILVAAASLRLPNKFTAALGSEFNIKLNDDVDEFLGMDLSFTRAC